MDRCKMLHETVLRDIIDAVDMVKDIGDGNGADIWRQYSQNKTTVGSIAKRAANLVLVFPVIVSNDLSIKTACMVSRALEQKCVSLLQVLFSSINLTHANNLQDYIAQFHTNIGRGMNLDDFISAMDKLVQSESVEVIDKDAYEAVMEDMKNINYTLDTSFNETSINNYVQRTDTYGNTTLYLQEDSSSNFMDKIKDMADNNSIALSDEEIDVILRNMYGNNQKDNKNKKNKSGPVIYYYDNKSDAEKEELRSKYRRGELSSGIEPDAFGASLSPQDVKKANDLVPTMVTVNFASIEPETKNIVRQSGVIGVKCKLYPVDSMEIISRIASKYKDSNLLFNFIRASTREISFLKDLVFALDKTKADAINMSSDSSNAKMFKLLERRARQSKSAKLLKRNDASPITSLVLSQNEVEYLRKYCNMDMDKAATARVILEKYNLMDIVIADESLEIVRMIFDDGTGTYEALSFDSLEKQDKDNSYKKVINLMSKINR